MDDAVPWHAWKNDSESVVANVTEDRTFNRVFLSSSDDLTMSGTVPSAFKAGVSDLLIRLYAHCFYRQAFALAVPSHVDVVDETSSSEFNLRQAP